MEKTGFYSPERGCPSWVSALDTVGNQLCLKEASLCNGAWPLFLAHSPQPAARTGIWLPGVSSRCWAVRSESTRGSRRTEEGACPCSGPEWLCQKLLLECFCVPFLSLCPSFHAGDREGQQSGLNLGPVEGQLRIPGGAWVLESDRLVFKF